MTPSSILSRLGLEPTRWFWIGLAIAGLITFAIEYWASPPFSETADAVIGLLIGIFVVILLNAVGLKTYHEPKE